MLSWSQWLNSAGTPTRGGGTPARGDGTAFRLNLTTGCKYQTATFCKLQIWACFGMTRVDTNFQQGLG